MRQASAGAGGMPESHSLGEGLDLRVGDGTIHELLPQVSLHPVGRLLSSPCVQQSVLLHQAPELDYLNKTTKTYTQTHTQKETLQWAALSFCSMYIHTRAPKRHSWQWAGFSFCSEIYIYIYIPLACCKAGGLSLPLSLIAMNGGRNQLSRSKTHLLSLLRPSIQLLKIGLVGDVIAFFFPPLRYFINVDTDHERF